MAIKNGYIFRDTFNDSVISRHRTESGAVKSAIRWKKQFARSNSSDSYLPTELVRIENGLEVASLDYSEENNRAGYICSEVSLEKEYRIYEAHRNACGGIDPFSCGAWDYVLACSASDAAMKWWDQNKHDDIDEDYLVVATDDDDDCEFYYPCG